MHRSGINAFSWKESATVNVLSSYHFPKDSFVYRRVRGMANKVRRSAPQAIVDFNIGMGGKDTGDMKRSRMTCHKRSRKWWKGIFYYVLDQVIICCNKIWNELVEKSKQLGMLGTMEEIVACFVDKPSVFGTDGPLSSQIESAPPKKRRRLNRNKPLPDFRLSNHLDHDPLVDAKTHNCVYCYYKLKKDVKTEHFCSGCNYALCYFILQF